MFRFMGLRLRNDKVKAYGFMVRRYRVRGGRISEYFIFGFWVCLHCSAVGYAKVAVLRVVGNRN